MCVNGFLEKKTEIDFISTYRLGIQDLWYTNDYLLKLKKLFNQIIVF